MFGAGLGATILTAVLDAFSLLLLIPFLRSLFGMGPLLPGGGRNAAERLIDSLAGGWLDGVEGLDALRTMCLLVLAVIVLKNLFFFLGKLASIYVQERVERDLRDDVYDRLTRVPLSFYGRARVGELISRVLADTREAKPVVTFQLSEAVRHAATVLAYLAALLVLSWRLTLVAVALLPGLLLVLRPVLRRLRGRFRRAYDQQGELVSHLQESLGAIRLVKSFRAEAFERGRFRARSDRYARSITRTGAAAHLASPLSEVLASVVALALVWVGASMVLGQGSMGPEQFLAFVTIALRAISPVKALTQFPAFAQGALAAADRFGEILDVPGEEPGPEGDDPSPDPLPGGPIEFRDVEFSYEADRPILRGLDLRVEPGEVVALVGPSGGGKSTLVDLLPRFIQPDAGQVRIAGQNVADLTLARLRGSLAIVSQDTAVFHDTVRANLAYARPRRFSDEQIREAARAAHAAEFIDQLPERYDTLLGDRGVRLSAGQRQRIGIARAFLRDAPILILDEATSALDAESEALVQDALRHLFAGRTVLMIAHRLSTIRFADRIVVLERGRLAEQGTHQDLLLADGPYRRLFGPQVEAAGEREGSAARE